MSQKVLESLINTVMHLNETHNSLFYMLFFIPFNNDDGSITLFYIALISFKQRPLNYMIDDILHETKNIVGNSIYGCDFEILDRNEILEKLTDMLES